MDLSRAGEITRPCLASYTGAWFGGGGVLSPHLVGDRAPLAALRECCIWRPWCCLVTAVERGAVEARYQRRHFRCALQRASIERTLTWTRLTDASWLECGTAGEPSTGHGALNLIAPLKRGN